jgi:hypothetical protein
MHAVRQIAIRIPKQLATADNRALVFGRQSLRGDSTLFKPFAKKVSPKEMDANLFGKRK